MQEAGKKSTSGSDRGNRSGDDSLKDEVAAVHEMEVNGDSDDNEEEEKARASSNKESARMAETRPSNDNSREKNDGKLSCSRHQQIRAG